MKKLIAYLLVVVTLMGMVGAEFTDKSKISVKHRDAVQFMSDKGIINGFTDGAFGPKQTLTRAQAAKIICTILVGADKVDTITAADAGFVDVPATHWADKFVDYCAEKGIVAGVGNGKFNPDGKLTGFAFAKMLLVAYGADAEKDGLTGAGWDTNSAGKVAAQGRNEDVTVDGAEMTREQACQLAFNFITMPGDYAPASLNMLQETTLYKTYGRTYTNDKGLAVNWPGNGIEFEVECSRDVKITYTSEESGNIMCYVDGEAALRPDIVFGRNCTATVAKNLEPGVHTIRLIREHDASSTGKKFELVSVEFYGKKETLKATPEKELYIEFIGDSITSGKGALLSYLDRTRVYVDGCHSGTASYAYVASQLLDADFSMLSRGSMGYTKVTTSCPKTIEGLYPYYNGLMENPIPFTTERQADIAVLALGTNDSKASMKEAVEKNLTSYQDFEGAAKWLMEQVRKQHGRDVKIVFIYGMMTAQTEWKPVFEALAAADPNVFVLKTTRNNDGGRGSATGTGHPSDEAHKIIGQELATFIQTEVLKK